MKRRVKITKKEIETIKNDGKPEIEAIRLVQIRAGLNFRDAVRLIKGYQKTGQKSITVTYKTFLNSLKSLYAKADQLLNTLNARSDNRTHTRIHLQNAQNTLKRSNSR